MPPTKAESKPTQDLMGYFERLLKEKNVRPEDMASDIKVSISTVQAWKYGRRRPNFITVKYLEQRYGFKVS